MNQSAFRVVASAVLFLALEKGPSKPEFENVDCCECRDRVCFAALDVAYLLC